MRDKNNLSLYALIISWLFLFSAAFYESKWNNSGSQATINWDVFGYYFYLPSLFYDNICELNNWKYIIETYAPIPNHDQIILQHSGCYVMKYSCGMAILYFPAFLVGHIWANLSDYSVDGFSFPYQFSLSIWALVVSFIGLWFIRKVLINYFNDMTVALSIIVLCFATNYFAYTSFTGSLSHNYLFTLYAIIIFLSDKWHKKQSIITAGILGVTCGIAALARPSEMIALLIPLLWGINNMSCVRERIHLMAKRMPQLIVFALFFSAMGLLQLIYWKLISGHWFYYSYQDQGFSFLNPHISNSLFSYKKGWLIYTPIMLLSLIGFIMLYQNFKSIFYVSLIFFILFSYVTFSWDIWWYGGSFSHRAMIQSYAILLFPLSSFIEYIYKTTWKRALLIVLIAFFAALNIFQTWQSLVGIMESDSMSRAYYWHIFGKNKVSIDDKRYIDTNEKIPEHLNQQLQEVYYNDFEDDNSTTTAIPAYSGIKTFEINQAHQFLTLPPYVPNDESGWYRATAKVFYWQKEWNFWWSTQFKIQLKKNGKVIKEKMIRVHRTTQPGSWQDIYVDIKTKDKFFDEVAISFWNANGNKTIYVDDVRLLRL